MTSKVENKINKDNHIISISQLDRNGEKYQKRKHILITGLCNNNCLFCFSKNNLKINHLAIKKIKQMFDDGISEGCNGLIISGGEPTLHPNFIEIISLAKNTGYKYIQIITNGRMFSYPTFLRKAKDAGLSEITFSIHGHNAKLHDYITQVKGSYNQVIKAVKLAHRYKIPMKINIVVNKKNIKHLKDMALTFAKLRVKTIGLLQIVPFGDAWINRNKLFYDLSKYNKNIKEFIEESKKKKISICSNRFDLELFEDYPELAQDPHKFINEVEARLNEFETLTKKGKELYCYPVKCNYCFLKDFCKELHTKNKKIRSGLTTKKDIAYLNENNLINPIKFAENYIKKFIK